MPRNELTRLPDALGDLSRLAWLDASDNQLTTIPRSVGRLHRLVRLDLHDNRLAELPVAPPHLTELDLAGNRLTEVPPIVAELVELTRLALGRNQIRELPEGLGRLTRLTWLGVADNELTSLPDSMVHLSQLVWLLLGNNRLATIPGYVSEFRHLLDLELQGNPATAADTRPTSPPRHRRIHCVVMVGGGEVALLPHFIEHYRKLGVESFFLMRHAESTQDEQYALGDQIVREAGLDFFHTYVGTWYHDLNRRMISCAMYQHPDDWYVVADLDELHVFDRPLSELTEQCDRDDYDHVNGCLLDRVSADGSFPDLTAAPIWQQYPLAGTVTAAINRAGLLQTTLARGSVELLAGQHGAPEGRPMPFEAGFAQIHHFKWTGSVLRRLRTRVRYLEDGTWPGDFPSFLKETKIFLDYADQHGGRIDVGDPRLRLHPCRDTFTDHPQWREIAEEAQGWRWTARH